VGSGGGAMHERVSRPRALGAATVALLVALAGGEAAARGGKGAKKGAGPACVGDLCLGMPYEELEARGFPHERLESVGTPEGATLELTEEAWPPEETHTGLGRYTPTRCATTRASRTRSRR
jgi:hypothetical protein